MKKSLLEENRLKVQSGTGDFRLCVEKINAATLFLLTLRCDFPDKKACFTAGF